MSPEQKLRDETIFVAMLIVLAVALAAVSVIGAAVMEVWR